MYVQVAKLWMSYHSTDAGTSHVSLSLPHVLGIDARPGVAPEHALVISAGERSPAVPIGLRRLCVCSHVSSDVI